MHIEPGLVDGAKMAVGYVTAAGVLGLTMNRALTTIFRGNLSRLMMGTAVTTLMTLVAFQMLPHPTVGVSEVHLILGSTLLLLFGMAPAGLGMALGLLLQGLLFEPADLAQYGMNVTTLLASLVATSLVAKRLISKQEIYVDLSYEKVIKLSLVFQGSIVAWVAFWVTLGQGMSVATMQDVAKFATAYLIVIAIEVLVSVVLLSLFKASQSGIYRSVMNPRLFRAQLN